MKQQFTKIEAVAESKGWSLVAILPNQNGRLFSVCQNKPNAWVCHYVLETDNGMPYFEMGDYCTSLVEALDSLLSRAGVQS